MQENASNDTDHGFGGLGFLIGTKASRQMIGSFRGITGSLQPAADSRAVCSKILAAVVAGAVLAVMPTASAGAKPFPTRVQVTAKEFWYALSSRSVKSGPAVIEFVNFGEDPHDMRVQKVGGGKVYGTPIVQPGDHYDLNVTLAPGRYQLWCSISNHRQLGMEATLIVKPRK